jgi:hypothetical protein
MTDAPVAPRQEREALAEIIWRGRFYSDTGDRLAGDILAAGYVTPEAHAAAIREAVDAERARIIQGLKDEADVLPCAEDAAVIQSCAELVRADFSYDEAERLSEAHAAALREWWEAGRDAGALYHRNLSAAELKRFPITGSAIADRHLAYAEEIEAITPPAPKGDDR